MTDDLSPERAEILRLRARIVVLERAVLASLEIGLRVRPEELDTTLMAATTRLAQGYEDLAFAPDIPDTAERAFIAAEVRRLMGGLNAELGHRTGKSIPENG